jgi:hypothetical protein
VLFEGEVVWSSLASFNKSARRPSFLDQMNRSIGVVFNTIEANMHEDLLGCRSPSQEL